MTMVAGTCRTVRSAEVRPRLVLAWSISPQAVVSAGLAGACAAARLEIEAPAPGQRGALLARLVLDGQVRELNGHAGEGAWLHGAPSLVHLDVPRVLHATVRLAAEAPQILYARTGLLEELGIGGGRYDFEGAQVR